ncbi:glutamyl-tRNA reductase [Parablautia muri]|nr:glutamyl-tRNA reductase [Parablautia muri]
MTAFMTINRLTKHDSVCRIKARKKERRNCMRFGFLGINYKKAQLDIRDRVSFTDTMKLDFFQRAEGLGVSQSMVLSTCNRSEVYFVYEKEEQAKGMGRVYEGMFPELNLKEYLNNLSGQEAMAYLFRVTAGLESLVLGEDQILGQVQEALDYSKTMGFSGKELNRIVRDAVTCAKRMKSELKISEKPLSVSYIGIRQLDRVCGIAGKRVLVIGSGKTATLALKYLSEYETESITACSRTYMHAKRLKEEFSQIHIIPYEERYQRMAQCHIVISATASPHLTVRRDAFKPRQPITFLDLASPRDIDTEFDRELQATLINLDALQEIAEENWRERERLAKEGGKIVEEALKETDMWLRQSRMDSAIESLQHRCSGIVEDSYQYLNRKMELSLREQKLLKKVLHASLQRLLREPIKELKRLGIEQEQEEYKRLIEQLFQFEKDGQG